MGKAADLENTQIWATQLPLVAITVSAFLTVGFSPDQNKNPRSTKSRLTVATAEVTACMRWTRKLRLRLRSIVRRKRVEQELNEELCCHLDKLEEENRAKGMTPDEARFAALRELGGVEQIKEECRDMRRVNFTDDLWKDLGFGLRQLRRNPGFTVVAVITLALGIGANTAIFSVVNGVLLRPLPYHDARRLVTVWEANPKQGYLQQAASPADFMDWKTQNQVFTGVAAFVNWGANLSGGERPERVNATLVSVGLFGVLGVKPLLGRTFVPKDQQLVPGQVAVLSYSLWRRRFGADRGLVGRTVNISGRAITVVGVMPPGFRFPGELQADGGYLNRPAALWFPLSRPPGEWKLRDFHYLQVIARLKAGVNLAQATAEMTALQRRIMEQHGGVDLGSATTLIPLHQAAVGKVWKVLLVLLGTVLFVLLIACVNVANLVLARASARSREFALRAALGAGRRRLVRQLLTESLLLSGLGGALGLVLAELGVQALLVLGPADLPRLNEIHIDSWVLSFTILVSVVTGLLFGLVPAFKASALDLNQPLKEGGWSTGESIRRNRLRRALLVTEVALAMVLLVGAGLMIQSLARLEEVNPGFDPEHLLTLQMTLAGPKYPKEQQQAAFFHQVLARIRTLPAVTASAATTALPLTGENDGYSVDIEGRPTRPNSHMLTADYAAVTPDYFRTLGIPLLRGRTFTERDNENAPPVVIVNQAFVRRYFPNENPIGKRIHVGNDKHPGYSEIVGIVGDIRHNGLNTEVNPTMYECYLQSPTPWMDVAVRTASDPMRIATAVRHEIAAVDKDEPISKLRTMNQVMTGSVAQPRFRTLLLTLFAFLALVLAAVGLYGMMSYTVAQQTHEMGIRLALGATPSNLLMLSLGQGMLLTFVGIGIGLIFALGLTHVLSSVLYGVRPDDPVTFAAVSLLFVAVTLLASYIPARRATKVDPMEALRYE
jgi:predicted permease